MDKRILVLSAILMCLTVVAAADTETANGVTWIYSLGGEKHDKAFVGSGYPSSTAVNTSGAITIPPTLGGCPVVSIMSYAFDGLSGLTSVTIPNSVTEIRDFAFRGCSGLTSMTIPSSVTSIGNSAFYGCSGLTSMTIPSSVTSIGNSAFYGCSSLKSVTIPSSVTSIGCSAFKNCNSLISMTIPNSVKSIGEYAFNNCNSLMSVTIPNSVKSIGAYAFNNCNSLRSVTIPDGVTTLGTFAFRDCGNLWSATIGNSVRHIADFTFQRCSSLRSVAIGNSVTNIGYYAFYGCSSLRSVIIPNSVTSIDSFAFEGCSGLKAVVIPNSVTSIGSQAFCDCSGLTALAIPNSVENNLGPLTFGNCSNLQYLYLPELFKNSFKNVHLVSYTCIVKFVSDPSIYTSTITLNKEGGSGGTTSFAATYGSALPDIVIPTRTGYTFGGYWTEANGGGAQYYYDSGYDATHFPYEASSATELYAKWSAKTFSVTLDAQSGSGGTVSITATYGSTMPSITVPTRTGYIFGGFWTEKNGGGTQYYNASGASVRKWEEDATTRLYAKWTATSYTVTLNRQSGSGGTTSVTATYGSVLPEITVPTRTGYTFGGYWTEANGGGAQYYYASGEAVYRRWETTSATTLYAKWTVNTYYVTLSSQLGIGGTDSVEVTYGSAMPDITLPTRTGYTFGGYYTSTGGSGTQYYTALGESARNWSLTSGTILYAKWTANTYTVTLNQQSGSGGTASVLATYDSEMPTITIPTRSGYTFGGYYTSTGGSGMKFYDASGASTWKWNRTSATTLYAKWTANPSSTVTLNRQGGSGGTASVTATYGVAMPTITIPTRTGYTFEGYYTSTGGSGTRYYNASGASVRNWDKTSNITLYAKWAANTYTVTLNQQSGSGGTASILATYDSEMPTITIPTRSGYTFGGYYTSTGGLGTQFYDASGASTWKWNRTSATTLYAKWTANPSSTVTLNRQGGSGGTASVTATYGVAMPTITIPTRTGYTFEGYWTEANGGGMQYYTASGESDRTWDKTNATTLYAKWSNVNQLINQLTIQSQYGTAFPKPGLHEYECGSTIDASVAPPEATDGVRFNYLGWTGTGSVPASGTATNMSFVITEDSTLIWNWERLNRITILTSLDGECGFGAQWILNGQTASATLTPPEGRYDLELVGDTNGVSISGAMLSITSDAPKTIDAKMYSWNRLVGTIPWHDAESPFGWSVASDASSEDGYSLHSAFAETGTASTNSATLHGPGTLTFNWRISANRGDYARLFVDGVQVAQITRNPEWSALVVEIEGDGDHIVSWVYDRKSNTPANDNAAYIDNVMWRPVAAATVTTPTPVPYAWLDKEAPTLLAGNNGNYEVVANSTAANGVNKVWECYVAGVCPTNATAKFMASITIGENGHPCISWHPDLNGGGTRQERIYRILGAKTLGQAVQWADVSNMVYPDAAGYRFFKVAVEMPQSATE